MTRIQIRDYAGILIVWSLGVFLWPFQNTPFIDDWVYAWSVEHFLTSGELKILDYSTSFNLLQILWGAVCTLPFGFSFTALRVSTWIAAGFGLCGMYSLLDACRVPRPSALMGTAVLGLYPVYTGLSFTFMTDILFVCALIWFCFAIVRAVDLNSTKWFALASTVACLATLTRPLAAALGATILVESGYRGFRSRTLDWSRIFWGCLPILLAGVIMYLQERHVNHVADLTWIVGSPAWRREQLYYGVVEFPKYGAFTLHFVLGALGIALLPLAIGVFSLRRIHRYAGATALIVALGIVTAVMGYRYDPMGDRDIWALEEFGFTLPFISETRLVSGWAPAIASVLSSSVLLGSLSLEGIRASRYLIMAFGILFCQMGVLWLNDHDRYALPLVALTLPILLCRVPLEHIRSASCVLAFYAVVGAIGWTDHMRMNGAIWSAVGKLKSEGIPDAEISAGWPVNGWLQYAHPENARKSATGAVDVPGVNGKELEHGFRLSSQPIQGWSIRETITVPRIMGSDVTVYVLHR